MSDIIERMRFAANMAESGSLIDQASDLLEQQAARIAEFEAQGATLTDERILEIAEQAWAENRDDEQKFYFDFARELLAAAKPVRSLRQLREELSKEFPEVQAGYDEAKPVSVDATKPCSPMLTQCPRCKNPHGQCDGGVDACNVNKYMSRMCELGTKGCTTEHSVDAGGMTFEQWAEDALEAHYDEHGSLVTYDKTSARLGWDAARASMPEREAVAERCARFAELYRDEHAQGKAAEEACNAIAEACRDHGTTPPTESTGEPKC